jgi:hypothetical protein
MLNSNTIPQETVNHWQNLLVEAVNLNHSEAAKVIARVLINWSTKYEVV